jgi:hypothetical protein
MPRPDPRITVDNSLSLIAPGEVPTGSTGTWVWIATAPRDDFAGALASATRRWRPDPGPLASQSGDRRILSDVVVTGFDQRSPSKVRS